PNISSAAAGSATPGVAEILVDELSVTDLGANALVGRDTLVLDACFADTALRRDQFDEVLSWVRAGGRLVLADGGCAARTDSAWVPYAISTRQAAGVPQPDELVVIVAPTPFGSTDSRSAAFVDPRVLAAGTSGGTNVMLTTHPAWCAVAVLRAGG